MQVFVQVWVQVFVYVSDVLGLLCICTARRRALLKDDTPDRGGRPQGACGMFAPALGGGDPATGMAGEMAMREPSGWWVIYIIYIYI